jgi:hypothetical protein
MEKQISQRFVVGDVHAFLFGDSVVVDLWITDPFFASNTI